MLVSIGKKTSSSDLCQLLLDCHARIRQFVALARHAGQHERGMPTSELADACLRVERYFVEALPLHVQDEEHSILPRLQGKSAALDQALSEMCAQHAAHESELSSLIAACRALREAPCDTRARGRLLDTACSLEAVLVPHLELEEAVVIPALRELSPAEQGAIVTELRARRERI